MTPAQPEKQDEFEIEVVYCPTCEGQVKEHGLICPMTMAAEAAREHWPKAVKGGANSGLVHRRGFLAGVLWARENG